MLWFIETLTNFNDLAEMKAAAGRMIWFVSGLLFGMFICIILYILFSGNPRFISIVQKVVSRDTIIDKSIEINAKPLNIKKTSKADLEINKTNEDEQVIAYTENYLTTEDTSINIAANNNNDLSIRKDELIQIVQILLRDLDPPTVKKSADSLLEQFEGLQIGNDRKTFTVELWRSPINYRGYKMIKNKIIAFGLDANDVIEIFKMDGKIYLRQANQLYTMKQTNEFDSFKRTEEDIKMKLLNKI